MVETGTEFEHDGFKCNIIERPDLLYGYTVYGRRKSDDKVFKPNVLFDRDMTTDEIIDTCRAMIDGIFSGKVERIGNYNVIAGAA